MKARIHIVVDEAEKERFRRQAEREGRSLSEWIRRAAREKLAGSGAGRPTTLEELREFWARCDEREERPEPDWEEHEAVIAASKRGGAARG